MLIQKTVYFREEDVTAWDAISNKAEWLHAHLNTNVVTIDLTGVPKQGMPDLVGDYDVEVGELCTHINLNKRTGICRDCGEYTR